VQGYWFVLNGFVEDEKKTRTLIKPYAILMELSWQELKDEHVSAKPSADPPVKTGISTQEFRPSGEATRTRLISNLVEIEQKHITSPLVINGSTPTEGSRDLKNASVPDLSGLSVSEMFLLKNTLDSDSHFVGSLILYPSHSDDGETEAAHYYKVFGTSYLDVQNFEKADYILLVISRFCLSVIYGFMGATVFLVRKIYQEYNRESLSESSTVGFRLHFFSAESPGLPSPGFLLLQTNQLRQLRNPPQVR
jgi:hypothetical protein